jgi:transketolase
MAATNTPASAALDPHAAASVGTIKALAMDAVQKANSGHPGTPMGLADAAHVLFSEFLRHNPRDPQWLGRDRFVLSVGHASMLMYAMLHLAGYDVSLDDLKNFRQWNSKTPGHPEVGHTPGVETTTGPLGQGIGNAVGMALAAKMAAARFGKPFEATRVWCIASDGDVMEGVAMEASSIGGHLGLDNLCVLWDDNRITIEGETDLAFTEDVGARYAAMGWNVVRIDGHDHAQLRAAYAAAKTEKAKPTFIVARTHIANGAPNAHDTSEAHGAPLGAAEIAATKVAMGFDPEKHFEVHPLAVAHYAAVRDRLTKEYDGWNAEYAGWRTANGEKATALDAFLGGALPANLFEELVAAVPAKDDATRSLSGAIQQKAAALLPGLVGGSADLGPSTKTLIAKSASVGRGAFEGRNLHFGIREHGMGAICNGMALFGGFIPYGSTFLIFSDYMRPSIRLSALMHQRALWIYTHDSVLLGEDGPTHQPIEQIATLRLIPGVALVRPADGLECAAAWTIALQRTKAPTVFALSRQKVPAIPRPAGFDPSVLLKGLYVAAEGANPAKLDVVLVASGAEVHGALEAKGILEGQGKSVRVVSALCLETFLEQPEAYRASVLPKGVRAAAFEAGRVGPWAAVLGGDAILVGIDRFGASAPDKVLAKEYGLEGASVAARIAAALG